MLLNDGANWKSPLFLRWVCWWPRVPTWELPEKKFHENTKEKHISNGKVSMDTCHKYNIGDRTWNDKRFIPSIKQYTTERLYNQMCNIWFPCDYKKDKISSEKYLEKYITKELHNPKLQKMLSVAPEQEIFVWTKFSLFLIHLCQDSKAEKTPV